MIENLLPGYVVSVDDQLDRAPFDRVALVASRLEQEGAESALGRECARRALALLGVPPSAIGRAHDGAPQWPLGVVGSITHRMGYCAAAVAWRLTASGIGIDAESIEPLSPAALRVVAAEHEIAGLPDSLGVSSKLLFSAKESVFKAWHAATGRRLGFRDATVRLDPLGTFEATVRNGRVWGDRRVRLDGRFRVADELVCTGVVVPAQLSDLPSASAASLHFDGYD